MNPQQIFEAALRERGYPGVVGLVVAELGGETLLALNPERIFPSASTIKLPLMIYVLARAQAGALDLAAPCTLRAEDQVSGSGVLQDLRPGATLSLQDVITLMITVSDNSATNMLIDRLGADDFNVWLQARGWQDTRLIGRLQLPPERQNAAQRRGERNRTSARDQAAMLQALAAGRLLNPACTAQALNILGRQQIQPLIGRGVPCGPDGEPLYRVASKSGLLNGVHHDVGILYSSRPLVVALLSQGGTDLREHPENRDMLALSRALWSVLPGLGDISPDPAPLSSKPSPHVT